MKCPVCANQPLHSTQIEGGLGAWCCGACAGVFIKSADYWGWRGIEPPPHMPRPPEGAPAAAPPEEVHTRVCPQCGHILGRYKVGGAIAFNLDKCGSCGGMWFDRNEWDTLRRHNLHDDVHFVFSDAWQRRAQRQVRADVRENRLQEIFGPRDLAELHRIRDWIASHPKSKEIRAFLSDQPPAP